ncbi:hypothetical protein F4553_000249 [Allocatelliglobosispora scoriae]|uniref:Uncharacterized protein n=1 Tax=Allocatelliglobosispora scoriae TaxID=643052 RepID=A0A841BJ74_9ACTN|nr:hypothetical protein [Allocatelliglobosispora scoriae]MBB5866870.1 hypothetical protein [Allocatelliglobosispora scoriae]
MKRVGTLVIAVLASTALWTAPAQADTGGGCASGSNSSVCISVTSGTTNPLKSDYYLSSTSLGEYSADVYLVYTYSSGPCTSINGTNSSFKGTVAPVWTGHSPVYSTTKPAGANCGRTHVIFRNSSGSWIYDNYSPWQRW